MKNVITWVFGCAFALTAGHGVLAAPASAPLALAADAPDRHVVVRGDTLWDISARFLQAPWRWPELWQLNREQIDNPHLIFPGDIVYLDSSGEVPRLRLGRQLASGGSAAGARIDAGATDNGGDAARPMRAEPMIRAEPLEREPIPTISAAAIAPFLNRPLIVDEKGLEDDPRIVATQEGRVYLGRGDLAYVRGIGDESVTNWHVYRSARPLLDPQTRKPIAHEAMLIGTAELIRKGDPATIRIESATEEIGEGDRLLPAEPAPLPTYAPRPPQQTVDGRIVAVYRGVDQVGRSSVVALNVGKQEGLDVGHVLAVQMTGRSVIDRQTKEAVRLPNETVGQLLVFRVFDKVSYGLVMQAARALSVGDTVTNP